jgi:hypothetical protein
MKNVHGDVAHAKVVTELKTELFRLKTKFGDPDEKFANLMAVRQRAWGQ